MLSGIRDVVGNFFRFPDPIPVFCIRVGGKVGRIAEGCRAAGAEPRLSEGWAAWCSIKIIK